MGPPDFYEALLRLLPDRVRRRWGGDMRELLRHRLERAGRSPLRKAWVWIRAGADIAVHAVAERLEPGGRTWPHGKNGKSGGRKTMRTTLEDLGYALRALRRAPFFSMVAVLTLAVGIGASTATFSVVDAVLLKELPVRDARSLVVVWPEKNYNKAMVTATADAVPALESVSGFAAGWIYTLTGDREPVELRGAQVSAHHFALLGVEPVLGRSFTEEEGRPGGAGVVILSHDLWVRLFGADPDVVGRTVPLSGNGFDRRTVVGVLPSGYRALFDDAQLWVPLEVRPGLAPEDDGEFFVNYRVGRLTPTATRALAQEQLRRFASDLRSRMPRLIDEEASRSATVQPLRIYLADGLDTVLWATLGAVSMVLLIACANVTNLFLARGEARVRDLAVRSALGAGRGRVIRMLLWESAVLGVAGGTLGVLLAHGLVDLLVRSAPPDFPRIEAVGVDGSVLAFGLAATLVATLVAGLLPALRSSRVDATGCLGGGARGAAARGGGVVSSALVTAEVALAVVIVVGSGLMLHSMDELLAVDPGLRGERVLTFRANPPESRYPDAESFRRYYESVLDRVATLPSVNSVGAINLLPGTGGNWSFPIHPEGVDVADGETVPSANFRGVVPGYFETVEMSLLQGRYLTRGDGEDAEKVLLVNQAFVDEFWPGEEAVGKLVRIFSPTADPYRVVGVVGDVRQLSRRIEPLPELYVSHEQWSWNMSMWAMVRFADGSPLRHAGDVRDVVWSVDPDVPISGVDELSAVLDRSTRTTRFLALLLTGFGGLALFLGAVGVFGVTTYTVARRLPEFGVRLALGSSRADIVGQAVRGSLVPVGIGVLAGLLTALFTSKLLDAVLYEVDPTDPVTFLGVTALLTGVAVIASLVPAWRASRVDPVSVLNSE